MKYFKHKCMKQTFYGCCFSLIFIAFFCELVVLISLQDKFFEYRVYHIYQYNHISVIFGTLNTAGCLKQRHRNLKWSN